MFNLLNVSLKNFRCFDNFDFEFPQSPGLYLISGKSGAGKTSIFSSIIFALFGKHENNIPVSFLCKRGYKTMGVEVNCTKNNQQFNIKRNWTPNNLIINNVQKDYKEVVIDDSDTFIMSMYSRPDFSFFDINPAERLTLLTKCINTSLWDEATTQCKINFKKENAILDNFEKELAFNKGKQESLINLQNNQNNNKHSKNLIKYDSLKNIVLNYKQQITQLTINKTQLQQKQEQLNSGIQKINNEINAYDVQITHVTQQLNLLNNDYCPTCQRSFSSTDKQQMYTFLTNNYNKALSIKKKFLFEKNTKHKELLKFLSEITQLNNTLEVIKDKTNELEKELQNLEFIIKSQQQNTNLLQKDIEQIQNQIYEAKQNKTIQLNKLQILDFWEQGFKDIKTQQLDSFLNILQFQTNNYIDQIDSLFPYKVFFESRNRTKKGLSNQIGFHIVLAEKDSVDNFFSLAVLSSGEKHKIRLALTLSLMNYTQTIMHSSVEFFDEPAKALPDADIAKLLNVLQNRAYNDNKKIIIIDHRDFKNRGIFESIYNI